MLDDGAAAPAGNRQGADHRPTFLLVDDDAMVGRMIAHAAEEFGHRAIRSTRFEGFIQSFEATQPDVVAVDLCVPGRDGIETIRFLANQNFRGAVLIISGLDGRVLDAALRLGKTLGLNMAEPIAKPFRIADFAERLGKVEASVQA